MTTCRDLTAFLAEYIGDELDAAIRENFEGHIARCPDCVVFIAQYRQTIQVSHAAFEEAPTEPVPEELVKAIVKAMKQA